MNRLYSDMTSDDLVAWAERHQLSFSKAADALGISRDHYAKMRVGRPIPRTVALLCAAIDRLAKSAKRPRKRS